jgi:hypothetical protein
VVVRAGRGAERGKRRAPLDGAATASLADGVWHTRTHGRLPGRRRVLAGPATAAYSARTSAAAHSAAGWGSTGSGSDESHPLQESWEAAELGAGPRIGVSRDQRQCRTERDQEHQRRQTQDYRPPQLFRNLAHLACSIGQMTRQRKSIHAKKRPVRHHFR